MLTTLRDRERWRPSDRAVAMAGPSPRARWCAAFAVFGLTGIVWAMSIPRLGGPDESSHVIKAVAVARGDLRTRVTPGGPPLPQVVPFTEVIVPQSYNEKLLVDQVCWAIPGNAVDCAPALPDRAGPLGEANTYVGTYQPIYYGAVGWPTRFLAPAPALMATRVVSALLVAALLASALVSLGTVAAKMAHVGFLLALTPTVVFLGGVVNPSGIEIAAAVGLWCALVALVDQRGASNRLVLRAAAAAACLVVARPLSPLLGVGIVVIVGLLAADRERLRRLWSHRALRWATGAVAVVWAASAGYVLRTDALDSVISTPALGARSTSQVAREALDRVGGWVFDQVGLLSFSAFVVLQLPRPIVVAWLAAVVALVTGALVLGSVRSRIVIGSVVVGTVLLPVAAEVVKPEVTWHGRYLLPLTVGIPILAGWVIDRSGRVAPRVASAVLVAVGGLVAVVHLIAHQAVLSRSLHGAPSPIWTTLDPRRWNGPLSPTVLVVLALVCASALAALFAWIALGTGSGPQAGLVHEQGQGGEPNRADPGGQ